LKQRLELAGRREDVAFAQAARGVSERRACKLLGVDRASYRYEPRPDRNAELLDELVKLARQKPRYGYRRLHAVQTREYQTDQSSLITAQTAARFVLAERQQLLQKRPHRSYGVDTVTPYQGRSIRYTAKPVDSPMC
jgi:hypothetical protein